MRRSLLRDEMDCKHPSNTSASPHSQARRTVPVRRRIWRCKNKPCFGRQGNPPPRRRGCPLLWGVPSTAMKGQRLATAHFAPDATRPSPPHELKSRRFAGPIIPNRHPPAWSWGAVPTPFGHSFTRRGSSTLTEFHSCGDKEFARRPAQSVVRTPASTEFGSSARDSACSWASPTEERATRSFGQFRAATFSRSRGHQNGPSEALTGILDRQGSFEALRAACLAALQNRSHPS